jgi:hypothetical protein
MPQQTLMVSKSHPLMMMMMMMMKHAKGAFPRFSDSWYGARRPRCSCVICSPALVRRQRIPSMRCVGYRQVREMIEGQLPATELRDRSIFATRQFAKRN